MNIRSLLLGFTFVLFSGSFMAQEIVNHEFSGKIFVNGKKAKDVTVKVFDGNDCFSVYKTRGNGKFVFTGGAEKHYTLQFEKEGYVTKRVLIKTFNTKELEEDTRIYKFDLDMVEEAQGDVDDDFPVAIIEIDSDEPEFKVNATYAAHRHQANPSLSE
jgi:hypothetical protein